MMNNKLVEECLQEENSFSSNSHGIDTITKDCNNHSIKSYPIPNSYGENKLVLLPVNKNNFYIYWELTNELLKSNMADLKDLVFHIIDQDHNLLLSIDCNNKLGQYFFTTQQNHQTLQVVLRYKHEIQLRHLLDSNIIKTFNTKIKVNSKDVWISKQKGFTEVIRSSLSHFTLGMSSKNYVDEHQRLLEFEKLSQTNYSSSDLVGDLK